MRWLREVITAHYYADPLAAILGDLAVGLLLLFGVLLIRFLLARYP